jgi:hypothetical protein
VGGWVNSYIYRERERNAKTNLKMREKWKKREIWIKRKGWEKRPKLQRELMSIAKLIPKEGKCGKTKMLPHEHKNRLKKNVG